jgi:hypothetical protein
MKASEARNLLRACKYMVISTKLALLHAESLKGGVAVAEACNQLRTSFLPNKATVKDKRGEICRQGIFLEQRCNSFTLCILDVAFTTQLKPLSTNSKSAREEATHDRRVGLPRR